MKRILVVLTALALVAGLTSTASGATDWQQVGIHPDAAAQPTARGRTLHDLHGFAGRVYVGYGDYGANTGPIVHRPWNPSTGQWEYEDRQDTEEVNNYQSFPNGMLFSPSIDPACCGGPLELAPNASDYANLNGNREWPDSDRFPSWHVFDIRQMGNGSVIAAGSDIGCSVSCAEVWRSDNGGASWYEWLRDSTDARGVYGGHRCYSLATHAGRAWANCTTGHKTWTGSSWQADTTQQYGHKEAITFAGSLVTPARGALRAYDGSERTLRSGTHRFIAVDGSTLYAVDAYHRVYSTRDLSSWASVGSLPSGAVSFTALDGTLYYGDANSTLWASAPIAAPTTTTTPALTPHRPRCFLGLFCT